MLKKTQIESYAQDYLASRKKWRSVDTTDPSWKYITDWLGCYPLQLFWLWCENLYNPDLINDVEWKDNIYRILAEQSQISSPEEILNVFHGECIRQTENGIECVSELMENFRFFATWRNQIIHRPDIDWERDTLGGYRRLLSVNFMTKNCSDIRKQYAKYLEKKHILPFDITDLSKRSYRDCVNDEENRESAVIDDCIAFDVNIIRPVLVQWGIASND